MKQKKEKLSSDSGFFQISNDIIPYACHYNENTILTKNGELLQVIRIYAEPKNDIHSIHTQTDDMSQKSKLIELSNLRSAIRVAILDSVKTKEFAFWIHTFREVVDMQIFTQFENEFANHINNLWNSGNDISHKYGSTLYVTILIEGKKINTKGLAQFFEYTNRQKTQVVCDEFFEKQLEKLNKVTSRIFESILKTNKAEILSIQERDGIMFSKILEFFARLLNLSKLQIPLDFAECSKMINLSDFSFHENYAQAFGPYSTKFFASITTKQYIDASKSAIDEILQLAGQFVIYQTFNFINSDFAESTSMEQLKVFEISNSKKLIEGLGLKSDPNLPVSQKDIEYGEGQIGIIVFANTKEELDTTLATMWEKMSKIGLVAVKDDIMLETSFYAYLPGNFGFLQRRTTIRTSKIAGLASVDHYPLGKKTENKWGDAISVFVTKNNMAYFFNFHDETGSGNTIIFGNDTQGKAAFINFLICQSLKFDPRVICIDFGPKSKQLFSLINGTSVTIEPYPNEDQIVPIFNIFAMLDNPSQNSNITSLVDQKFIVSFLYDIFVFCDVDEDIAREEINNIADALEENNQVFKRMSDVATVCTNEDAKDAILTFAEGGEYGHIFDCESDIFDYEKHHLSIDILNVCEEEVFTLVFSYIYFRLNRSVSSRTILKVDKPEVIFQKIELGQEEFCKWLDFLALHDTVFIASVDMFHENCALYLAHKNDKFSTTISFYHEIYFYYAKNQQIVNEIFEVNVKNKINERIRFLEDDKIRNMIILHGGKTVFVKFDFDAIASVVAILSGIEVSPEVSETLMNKEIPLEEKMRLIG